MAGSFQRKIALIFAWINFSISFLLVLSFAAMASIGYSSVDAKAENKVYAFLLLVLIMLFPAVFLFLNGLILRSKCSGSGKKEEFKDF